MTASIGRSHSRGSQVILLAGSIQKKPGGSSSIDPFFDVPIFAYGSRRRIRGLPSGTPEVFFEFDVHRVYCPGCRSQKLEELHFLSHAKARMTRRLERTVLELRKHMSIRAVCGYFHLRWHTVKELEKESLARKFRLDHCPRFTLGKEGKTRERFGNPSGRLE